MEQLGLPQIATQNAKTADKADAAWVFHVLGQPVPKERPQFDRRSGRMYTPKRTREYERTVSDIAKIRRPKGWPLDARYAVTLRICNKDALRRDGTNILKAVEDALNGVAWKDDNQIATATWTDEIDRENPRVEITIEILG